MSIKAARYLKAYIDKWFYSGKSLKRFLYGIREPGKRKKRIQRIIYGIFTNWVKLNEILKTAGLDERNKMHFYLVAAFRAHIDGWSADDILKEFSGYLTEEEVRRIVHTNVTYDDEISRLSIKFGYPKWFVKRLSQHTSIAELSDILEGLNRRVSTWIIINALRAEENDVVQGLEEKGYVLEKDRDIPLLYRLVKLPKKIQETQEYRRGLVLPMQKSSSAVVYFMNPKSDEIIYDSCAAPGIKSIYTVILSGGAKVIAVDKSRTRLMRMRSFVRRYGVDKNIRMILEDARYFKPDVDFDKALVDAPCTSTGTIPKNPEIKIRLQENDVHRMAKLQYSILSRVLKIARRGVLVTYATCSIFPEENELLIEKILANNSEVVRTITPNLGVKDLLHGIGRRFWPHIHDTVGMFYVGLIKSEE